MLCLHFYCALDNGTLWSSGYNNNGNLGNAYATTYNYYPAVVTWPVNGQPTSIQQISCGYLHSLVLTGATRCSPWSFLPVLCRPCFLSTAFLGGMGRDACRLQIMLRQRNFAV